MPDDLTLSVPADPVDPDPLPRPAPVGPGSAFRAVADAAPVAIRSVEVVDAPVLPAPRRRPLRSWRFDAGDAAPRPIGGGGGGRLPASGPVDPEIGRRAVTDLIRLPVDERIDWLQRHVWPHEARLLAAFAEGPAAGTPEHCRRPRGS